MKSGWAIKKLGEVCELINGKNQSEVANPSGKYPIYGSGGVMGRADDFRCPAGCTIIGRKGSINNPLYVTEPFWNVDTAYALSPTGVESKFLYYFCLSFDFSKLDCGTTIPSLTSAIVKDVDIPIPPLPEQKRIVAKIDAAFEKIDKLKANAEKNLANAKELFQSALDEAMRPKDGWVEKRLGEVANIRVGPFGSSLHKADYVENGVPLVNPCHMKDSKIADKISTQVSHNKAESLKEYRLRAGDIVFARRGEIGRLAFVSEKEDGYLCGTGSLFARFRERFDIQFLYFFFSSKSFVERLEMLSTGTTMKSINSSALESMSFSVPPMNEQQRLAQQFDSLAEKIKILEQNYTQQIADCVEMRQAVLREAFEWRL